MTNASTILAVDDMSDSLALLVQSLTTVGYHVRPADSGELAMAAVAAEPPDLILLDVRMRGMDGLEVCRQLKSNVNTRSIPIILISAFADAEEWVRGLQMGAADFITKPFQREELLMRVKTQIALREASCMLETQEHALHTINVQLLDEAKAREQVEQSLRGALAQAERSRLALQNILEDELQAQATLRVQSTAMNAAADAIVITGLDGSIEWVNGAFTDLTQYSAEEAIGRNPRALVKSGAQDVAVYQDLWDTILAGRVWRGELTNRRKDLSEYPEAMTITPVKDAAGAITRFVAIKRDLTEHRRLETQVLQGQKMETVGQLAGGIAHDFNNLLTVINGTAEYIQGGLRDADPLRTELDEIRKAGGRAASLTRQLLAFSRKQVMKFEVINVNALLTNLRGMLTRVITEDIALVMKLADDLACVRADGGQVEQVVLNLVLNARDAMPRGGTLVVTTRNVELDEALVKRFQYVVPGSYVMIAVTDTGIGMDDATQARVFEPFFTTKSEGKGTGLGLASVYGTVKQSGGYIFVDSTLGNGATFNVYLPQVADVADRSRPAPPVTRARGTETILVVEDDAALRAFAERALRSAGYTVLTAVNGGDALAVLRHITGPLHLVFTDVVMPGMNGADMADVIRESDPDMKVLFSSGYADDVTLQHGVLENMSRFLQKPYSVEELQRKVRAVLDA